MPGFDSIDALRGGLTRERYLVDDGLATVVFLALRLKKPLLVEGEPGVGKTELAKALASAMGAPLIRLQCYEGIDVHHALYDCQVTIPEVGVVRANEPPAVVITSNRTRDLHEALKRRCLYHWIDHPDLQREVAIARARLPEVGERLAAQVCAFVQDLRWLDLYRSPGVGETLDWASAFHTLGRDQIDPATANRTLGTLLKERDDLDRVRREGLDARINQAGERAAQLRA